LSEGIRKRCTVAYATRERQWLWPVDLPADATVADAIEAARGAVTGLPGTAAPEDVPWTTAPVGIFGELRHRLDVPSDGDRIEIYRPLRSDPRERRRERVQRDRRSSPAKRPGTD